MKKILLIFLLAPLSVCAQWLPITINFQGPNPAVNSKDSIRYNYSGKAGGYSYLYNAEYIQGIYQKKIVGSKPAPTGNSYVAGNSVEQALSNLDNGVIKNRRITPNLFTGSDVVKIQKAVDSASVSTGIVYIPTKAIPLVNKWVIDSAIKVPSNVTIYIENTKIKLSDACRDNFFRSKNCGHGITTVLPESNIAIIGIGEAILEGADNPRSTGIGKSMYTGTRPGGTYSYGTDANDPSQEQLGDWRNDAILLANVSFFTITNLKFVNVHGYSMLIERSNNGNISNINLSNPSSVVINGITQGKLNLDGLDIIDDCYNIEVNNITGLSGDDICNIGIYDFTSGTRPEILPGAYGGAPIVAGSYYVAGADMRFINVRNIKATPTTNLMRLLPIGNAKIHDIILDNIEDSGTSMLNGVSSVIVGDINTYGDQAPITGIYNITIQNINTNYLQYSIRVRGGINNGTIRNITKSVLYAAAPIVFDGGSLGFSTDVVVENVNFLGTSTTTTARYNGKILADNITRSTAGVVTASPYIFTGPAVANNPNVVLTLDSKGTNGSNRGPKLAFNAPVNTTTSVAGGGIYLGEVAASSANTFLAFSSNIAGVETTGMNLIGLNLQLPGLTASSAVATDASKNLVSVSNTGTGNNVLSTSPTFTGTPKTPALALTAIPSGTPGTDSLLAKKASDNSIVKIAANYYATTASLNGYITNNTNQTGLTGTKNTGSIWTFNAGINSNGVSSFDNSTNGYSAIFNATTGSAIQVNGFAQFNGISAFAQSLQVPNGNTLQWYYNALDITFLGYNHATDRIYANSSANGTRNLAYTNDITAAARAPVYISSSIALILNNDYFNLTATQYTVTLPTCLATDASKIMTVLAVGTGGVKISLPSGYSMQSGSSFATTTGTGGVTLTQGTKVQVIPIGTNAYYLQPLNGSVTLY